MQDDREPTPEEEALLDEAELIVERESARLHGDHETVAAIDAEIAARNAGLRWEAVLIARYAAVCAVEGISEGETEAECLHRNNHWGKERVREAIAECKRAGVWPWRKAHGN
jgi:hypothetical protein